MDKVSFLGTKVGFLQQLGFPDLQKHWQNPVVLSEAQNICWPLRLFQKFTSKCLWDRALGAQRHRSTAPQTDRSSGMEDEHTCFKSPLMR